MTTRTRYFLLGAALILAVGLGTGLVAYYTGDLRLFQPAVGPEELVYVPPDASGVAYANVREIMDSEFRQRLRESMPTGQGKDEFFNQTGIDIEHDIQSVVASMAGGGPGDQGLLLIRGRFDVGRIEGLIRQHSGVVEDYQGNRLMVLPERSRTGAAGPCLTFPETGLAMLGSEETVKRAIDAHERGDSVTDNDELMSLVAQVHNVGNSAWAVGGLDAVTSNRNVPAQVRDQLPGIDWVAVSAHVNGGVSGRVLARAKDEQAATDLRAVVNGAVAAGRLMAGRDPRLDALLNSLQVTGAGRDVDLAFSLSPDVLDLVGRASGAGRHDGVPEKQ